MAHKRASSLIPTRSDAALLWFTRIVASLGMAITAWAALRTGSMLVHGHPAYVVLLVIVFLAGAVLALRTWLKRTVPRRRFKALRMVGLVAWLGVAGLAWWLVPFSAVEPALSAMDSDANLTVTESAGQILLAPTGTTSEVGVFFQPGARVDARAYAAVLRPLAENGFTVVIPKQPFGIAFLSTGAFDSARAEHRPVDRWVLGGHSLGGVVAAMNAETFARAANDPSAGLLFYASYPSTDMSALDLPTLSISGSQDGLATPVKVNDSKPRMPGGSLFTVIKGGSHADFGDYGPQPGDGKPTISRDFAREQISEASLAFVRSLAK